VEVCIDPIARRGAYMLSTSSGCSLKATPGSKLRYEMQGVGEFHIVKLVQMFISVGARAEKFR
jgi:hypothetical protein